MDRHPEHAKRLIRRFVDEVAEVLRTQVQQTNTGTVDQSVPPKRVFRNLDLQRTIWKNLTNWNSEDERLYVDRLFYRQTAKRTTPARLIVVVDQSGSMVDSMVNCTILASVFAGLPKVDVHLIAVHSGKLGSRDRPAPAVHHRARLRRCHRRAGAGTAPASQGEQPAGHGRPSSTWPCASPTRRRRPRWPCSGRPSSNSANFGSTNFGRAATTCWATRSSCRLTPST
ncbi:MAG: hypothetical protein QOE61_632 [Micromonosporaceae bacterium]|nr:hypothetical protein [Micromonosporaceae bacterium]